MAELRRHLGLFQTTMYGIGLILGAGIYALIGDAAGQAGSSVWISFVLAAVAAVFTGLSYAELSSIYPKAAAEYSFVKRAFGNNFVAFIVGWLTLFVAIISASAIAIGFGGYFSDMFGVPILLSAILLIAVLSFVNFFGIRESSSMNVIFTMIEAAGLALIVWIGFALFGDATVDYFEMPHGFSGVFSAFTIVFFAYIGFENIANIAEEVRNPKKVLPRAIILAISITAIVYVLVSVSATRVLSWQELDASIAPLADVAERALGPQAHMILSFIALFATTNTVLIMLISGSRIMYGIATEKALPPIFGRVHLKRKTPWVATITVGALAVVFAFAGNIATIVNISVFAIIMVFVMVNFTLIWMRLKYPDAERAFKVPLSVRGFPILPALGIITPIIGIAHLDWYVISMGLGVVAAGMVFYFAYSKVLQRKL
ncbi:APC family permease [Candidatus Nitrosotenuis cloacae]|uniref:APC family permease n=1 Tax=Candidatus Nitrosotenuis cloacae TaxID=1603555 RepID=UPI002280AFED|nr:amino acid permease [Candidatus Nitrosotenuis cloacae]